MMRGNLESKYTNIDNFIDTRNFINQTCYFKAYGQYFQMVY